MKKFLGKLFTFALYAFVIGAIGKGAYDMFGDTNKLKKEAELVDRYENFVPAEVSPYIENPDYAQYYYKSIGGEFYAGQSWEMEGIPSYVTMTGGGFEEQDVMEYFSYDETVHTFIISEELLSTLSKKNGKPRAVVANTVKAHGISFLENNKLSHQCVLSKKKYEQAVEEIKEAYYGK